MAAASGFASIQRSARFHARQEIPQRPGKLFAGGEGATSLLIGAQGVGAVAGALSLASLARRYGHRRVEWCCYNRRFDRIWNGRRKW